MIDDRLADAIKFNWHDHIADGELLNRLFRDGAQIGSFGTRIDIGYAIGLYGEETYKDLKSISKIRNAFAHKLAPKDFKNQKVKDWANNLTLPDRFPLVHMPSILPFLVTPENPAKKFEAAKVFVSGDSIAPDINDSKHRFIRSAEILNGLLTMEASTAIIKKPPYF